VAAAGRLKRLRRELRVRALLFGLPLMRVLPAGLGALLGHLAWYLVPRQRRLAQAHLAIAFPQKTPAEREAVIALILKAIDPADIIGQSTQSLRRAALDAEMRRRPRASGPEVQRINRDFEIKFTDLMEEIRDLYAKRVLSGQTTNNSAFQQEIGKKVLGYLSRMSNTSRAANDALIVAGERRV